MTGPAATTRRWWHALAVVPVVAILAAPYVANRDAPRVFGLPFLLAWLVGWVLMTAVVMGLIYWLDERAASREARNGRTAPA